MMDRLRHLRLLALLFGLALMLAARPMPPTASPAGPVAHAHAAHALAAALPDGAGDKAPRDLACEISCVGVADPAAAAPFIGLARRVARLRRPLAARPAAGRRPGPLRHPPRSSCNV